jgi:hypothetical protein
MTKALLTTPCQPYPTQARSDSLADVMPQQFSKRRDIFTMGGFAVILKNRGED